MIVPALLPWGQSVWFAPRALFVLVVVAASLCVATSAWLLSVGHRQGLAEVSFVGTWFLVLSVLPLVHGLTTPGVLYGPNEAFAGSVLLAGPLAGAAALPMLFRESEWANRVARRPGRWVWAWAAISTGVGLVLLVRPNLVGFPGLGAGVAIVLALPSVGLAMLYSWRHLTMASISGSTRYLAVFAGFVFTGVSQLVWVTSVAFGPTFWFAHLFDISGVFIGTIGGAWAYLKMRPPSDLVGPVLAADPLVALDLALDPSVDAFVADLDAKDPVTRDHVLRTAESAMQVATMSGLAPIEVRDTGIGAVLHDIGKLQIPDAILNKPGRLDADEFEVMKTHAAIGGDLLAANPALEGVAPIVRAHHERMDGRGYPDGLAGEAIPVSARIIAVCDAYDAMAHDRPYRAGMGRGVAVATLRQNAGTQWDPDLVATFAGLAETGRVRTAPTTLDHVGRHSLTAPFRAEADDGACGCLAALPDEVAEKVPTGIG